MRKHFFNTVMAALLSLPSGTAQATAGNATVYGSLIFADGWAWLEDAPYGIYSFPASPDASISLVRKDNRLVANGAGTYIDGKYYMIGYKSGEYGEIGDICYRVFDVDAGWKQVREVPLDYQVNIPTDLTYDPVTDKVYGCFWGSDGTFTFATLNLLTGQPKPIAPLSEQLVALAADATGCFYAVGISGNVFRLENDGSTVKLNKIGRTGLNLRYAQSAAFDHASGRLLFSAAMHDMAMANGLYEVDTTDGTTTLITDYPDGYEITGIYTTAPFAAGGAPGGVTDVNINAAGASLTGEITFNLPVTTMSGGNLAGEVSYSVCLDDNDATACSGKGAPGGKITVPFTFGKAGTHMVRLSAVNGTGRGPVSVLYKWIGADRPKAVNPVMHQTTTGLSVSWGAPVTGVNGGYINTSALTYRVVRQPEGKTVYDGPSTTFSEDITITDLDYYWYDVTAVADGIVGETAPSNRMKLGTACPVPYYAHFDTDDDFDWFTVTDANADGHTWLHYDGAAVYEPSMENGADDWLVTPPLTLNPQYAYKLKMKVKAGNAFLPEKMEVAAGISPETTAMIQPVAAFTDINWTDYRELSAVVIPSSATPTHIGFRVCSEMNRALLYLDDISVEEAASVHGPDSVTELTATAGGPSSVTVSFRLPLKTVDGSAAAATNKVEVYRRGRIVKAFDGGLSDGTDCSFTDDKPLAGNNTYEVVPYNAEGRGMPATVTVFAGEDTPAKAENIKLEDLGGGNLRLTWDAPAKGRNGGYIDPATLQYEVSFAGGAYGHSETVSRTEYTGHVDIEQGRQRLAWYEITPVSPLGTGETAASEIRFLGDAYPLPFKESFARMSLDNIPWNIISDGVARWDIVGIADADAQDADGGLAMFSPLVSGGSSKLVSPKFTLDDSTNPVLSFWIWHHAQADNRLQVMLLDTEGTEYPLMETEQNKADFGGLDHVWKEYRIALDRYRHLGDVQLLFKAVNRKYTFMQENNLCLDNIVIRSVFDMDLAIDGLTGGGSVKVGEKATFGAMVENRGASAAGKYTVELYRNGKLVDTAEGDALNPDETVTVTLSDTPNADAPQTSVYHAVVNYPEDQKTDNNRTEDIAVTVLPGLPFVDTLTGDTDGTTTRLFWKAPWTNEAGAAGEVTDDFESYAPFAISDVGQWTMTDSDGSMTGGIISGDGNYVQYPNVEDPKAFIVFNPGEAGLSSQFWSAHSGKQTMACFLSTSRVNDDWLISPELDGDAQTIKFWATAPDCSWFGTQETVQVMCSYGGTATADFIQIGPDIIVDSEEWQQYSVQLPEGARHFAIRCVSRDQYILYIDDVTYRPAGNSLTLTGYNIYRDGQFLQSVPHTATGYTDETTGGYHEYTVTAVYGQDESIHSNVYRTTTTGIGGNKLTGVSVSAAAGSITVAGAGGLPVSITSAGGSTVWSGKGNAVVTVPPGVYIVKTGTTAAKLHVK